MSAQRHALLKTVTECVLAEMINDEILTVTMQSYREIRRGRIACSTCGTKCRSHDALRPSSDAGPSRAPSRSGTPQPSATSDPASSHTGVKPFSADRPRDRSAGYLVGPEKGTGGATGIGSGSGRMQNGNVYFDCLVCGQAVVSSRYAPHLSGCLGMNGSTRRAAARTAATKVRLGSGAERSSSYQASDAGDSDDGSVSMGGNGGGGKKRKPTNGSGGANGQGKRMKSPSKGGPGALKRSKMGSSGSGAATPNSLGRPPRPPSRLGAAVELLSPVASPVTNAINLPGTQGSSLDTAGAMRGASRSNAIDVDMDGGDESDEPDDY